MKRIICYDPLCKIHNGGFGREEIEEMDTLARYNSEVARGLLHSADWHFRMAALWRKFNETQKATS